MISKNIDSTNEQIIKEYENKISTLPWIEKYRPKTFDDIVSHNITIKTLKKLITTKNLPHILFYGPPGTGKTSTIMVCAKELYGEYYDFMVMELNASDDRGIEVVRNKIKQFVISQNVFFGKNTQERKNIFKLVILDETDAMTDDAQAILRKVIEKYTNNTRFCLICNYIKNINPALQSRCTKFRFAPLNYNNIKPYMLNIIKQEDINVTECGINTIIKRANGDMRKILNNLQSISIAYDIVDENIVNICLGYPSKEQMNFIITCLINDNFKNCYDKIIRIKKKFGLSISDIVYEIHDVFINFIINNYSNEIIKNISIDHIKNILNKLRIIEYNQSVNITENIQLAAIIGIFKLYTKKKN